MSEVKITTSLTRRDLYRIQYLLRQIKRDETQLENLRELAEGMSSVSYDNVKVQTSPDPGNKFAAAAADLSEIIDQEVEELERLQDKLEQFTETLTDSLEIRVLQLRYIDGYDWRTISGMVGYAERHVFRIHNRAVDLIP